MTTSAGSSFKVVKNHKFLTFHSLTRALYVSGQNLIAVFGGPNKVVLEFVFRMAASSVLHDADASR
jgi:hypothetical protein